MKFSRSQRPSLSCWVKATREAPICEVSPLCRGLWSFHARKECTGIWNAPTFQTYVRIIGASGTIVGGGQRQGGTRSQRPRRDGVTNWGVVTMTVAKETSHPEGRP